MFFVGRPGSDSVFGMGAVEAVAEARHALQVRTGERDIEKGLGAA